jgi:hypothetical protein
MVPHKRLVFAIIEQSFRDIQCLPPIGKDRQIYNEALYFLTRTQAGRYYCDMLDIDYKRIKYEAQKVHAKNLAEMRRELALYGR